MWFCRQCNQWYNDSVHVLKHIQTFHKKSKPVKKNNIVMVSDRIMAPGSVFTNKQISILKSAKSLGIIRKSQFVKTKSNEHKLVNGFQPSKTLIKTSSANRDQMSLSIAPPKSVNSGLPTSVTQKVKVVQIAKSNDLASLSEYLAKKMTKTTMLEQIKTYICKYCCRKFPNSSLLDMHQKSHGPNANHACHICGAIASNFSSLMCHYVKHSSGKSSDHQSVLDKSKVGIGNALKKIIRKQEAAISCTQCKRTFNTKEVFNRHYCPALNKKNEYPCTYCRKTTSTVEEYRDHIQSHVLPFICSSCNTQFSKKSQLSAHASICPRKKLKTKKTPIGSSLSKGKRKMKLSIPQIKTQPQSRKSQKKGILETACIKVENDKATEKPLDEVLSPPRKESSVVIQNSTLNQNLSDVSHAEDVIDTSTNFLEQAEIISSPKTTVKRKRRRRRRTVEMLSPESESERPTRTLRSPSRYVTDANSAYAPTRRSARLVNRKRITFSDDDELSEIEEPQVVSIQQDVQSESIKRNEEATVKIECPEPALENENPEPLLENEHPEAVIKQEFSEEMIKQECPEEVMIKKNVPKKRVRKSQNKAAAMYCQVCSLLFRSSGSLRRHKKMHTGKPQFVCQFCGKFFFRRDIHLRHENSVHQNSADKGFCCYYCKRKFESSVLLKAHSTEAHATKALVPERIRRCTGKIKCTDPPKTAKNRKPVTTFILEKNIKKEPVDVPAASSIQDIESGSTQPPLIKVKNSAADIDNSIHSANSQECIGVKLTDFKLNKCLLQKEPSTCHIIPTEKPIATRSSSRLCSKDVVLNTSSTIGNDNSTVARFNLCNVCKLCSKELTENFTCCPEVIHKAVDWYQCLVCAYSGTKMQVKEHMFTHTLKIGTIVVSEEDQDYNGVRTFLPLFSDALDGPEYDEDERTALEHINEIDVLSDNGDSNSSCTLMEEVKCIKCGEIIVDLEVLIQHPCIEISHNSYSCFIEFCHYNTDMKSSVQKHLVENHYTSFFADVLSKPTCKRKAPEQQHYETKSPFKRHVQQIENIFIEPSSES